MQFRPDMNYFLTFTTLDGATTNAEISGTCYYYRVRRESTPVSSVSLATNELEVVIQTTASPDSVWMLEKKTDGTFTPLTEITNRSEHDYYDLHYYDYSQNLRLTKKQILRLLDGKFYAHIKLSNGSNYISHLTNDFRYANGPTPVIRLWGPICQSNPVVENIPIPNYVLIAKDNHHATVAFDGLQTVDPFFLSMRFKWVGYQGTAFWDLHPFFTNNGPIIVNNFDLGACSVSLQASDVHAAGSIKYVNFIVITPSQAANALIEELQVVNLPEQKYKILVVHLQNAFSYFDQGRMPQGCNELDLFIKQAKAMRINNWVFAIVLEDAQMLRRAFD